MFDQLEQAIDFLGNLPSDSVIRPMFVSLAIAIATAGIFRWLSRREPVTATVLITLVFVANLACIVSTACMIQSSIPTVRVIGPGRGQRRHEISYMYDHVVKPDAGSPRSPAPQTAE